MKIQKTVKPERPAKDVNEWVEYLMSIGVRFNPNSNYNQKETKTLRLTSR